MDTSLSDDNNTLNVIFEACIYDDGNFAALYANAFLVSARDTFITEHYRRVPTASHFAYNVLLHQRPDLCIPTNLH